MYQICISRSELSENPSDYYARDQFKSSMRVSDAPEMMLAWDRRGMLKYQFTRGVIGKQIWVRLVHEWLWRPLENVGATVPAWASQPQVAEESQSQALIVFFCLYMATRLHTPFCSLTTWLCRSLLCCTDWDNKPIYRFFSALVPHSAKQKGCDNKKTTTIKGSVCFLCHFSTATKQKKDAPRFTDYGGCDCRIMTLFCSILISLDRLPRSDPLLERDTFSGHNSPFPI